MNESKQEKWLDNMLHTDKKQQQKIKAFFKEETTWCPEHVVSNFVGAFFIVIFMIFQMFPYQMWNFQEDRGVVLSLVNMELLGFIFYLQKYNTFNENGKTRRVDELLKYLPVSDRQLYIFRLKQIVHLCIKLTLAAMIFQTMFALIFEHTFSVMNLLWPLFWSFVVPVGLEFLSRWTK